jgi:hypothetical protein
MEYDINITIVMHTSETIYQTRSRRQKQANGKKGFNTNNNHHDDY